MQVGRVCGTVVSTLKHEALSGRKLLLVQPCLPDGTPAGSKTMAIDVVDAGPRDWVLLLDEGTSASSVLGTARGPIRTVVVGVLDEVQLSELRRGGGPARQSKKRQGVDSP